MCPMRFILVFFSASAVLAGYFAWRAVRSSPDDRLPSPKPLSFKNMAENGFWGFVDMASGRYLWRWIKELRGVLPEDTHPKIS